MRKYCNYIIVFTLLLIIPIISVKADELEMCVPGTANYAILDSGDGCCPDEYVQRPDLTCVYAYTANTPEPPEILASTRNGYTFLGWYLKGTNIQITNKNLLDYTTQKEGGCSGQKEDLQLEAKWQKNCDYTSLTVMVNYDTMGGATIESKEYNYNERFNLPTPTRPGYKFAGWYLEKEYTTSANSVPVEESAVDADNCPTAIKPVTIYAKWEEETVQSNNTNPTPDGPITNPDTRKDNITITLIATLMSMLISVYIFMKKFNRIQKI